MGEGGPGGKENSGKTNALTHVKGQLESLSDNLEYCIFFPFFNFRFNLGIKQILELYCMFFIMF